MALFKVNRGNSTTLPSTKTDGYAYFCADTGEFFIDYADSNGTLYRKQINADEAKKLTGYDITTILNSSDVEIPTSKAVLDALNLKQDKLTFDSTPTDGSTNPVTSEGIKNYVDDSIILKDIEIKLPTSSRWLSICYGDGKFVAVGNNSKAAYSTDGITWHDVSMPSYQKWMKVVYGEGKFVALSFTKIAYSTDGITWSEVAAPSKTSGSHSWSDLAYGNGVFVITAKTSSGGNPTSDYAYSTDGINWTKSSLPSALSYPFIAYGNGKFVTCSGGVISNSYIYYSEDGISWDSIRYSTSINSRGICYVGDRFIIKTDSSGLENLYSTDGIAWNTMSTGLDTSTYSPSYCYGNGMYVAVTCHSTADRIQYNGVALYSNDGITWTQTTMPFKCSSDVIYGDGKFVALHNYVDSYDVSTDTIMYSDDGINWHSGMSQLQTIGGEDVTSSTLGALGITPESIGAASVEHDHDDIYYTETEIDEKLDEINTSITSIPLINNLQDGISTGSLRAVASEVDSDSYTQGANSVNLGYQSKTQGAYSFAIGMKTEAQADSSYAEGAGSKASAYYAHAEGYYTQASGNNAHSEGSSSKATGHTSHAEGYNTIAAGKFQHVQGMHNVEDASSDPTNKVGYAHILGNGVSNSERANAHTVDWNGNAWFAGDVYVGSTYGKNKDDGSVKLVTETEMNNAIAAIPTPDVSGQINTHNTSSSAHSDIRTAINTIGNSAKQYTDQQIAAIPTPDVSGQIGIHNTSTDAHNDIRDLIDGLTTRLNTLANSDDTTLDQMAEVVAYIKANRELIESVTTNKVSVSDIINNLTTNVSNKPLSAAQGVVLKSLIDAIPSWAKATSKPTYTASEVGADASGTASSLVSSHNSNTSAHSDIRTAVSNAATVAANAKTAADSKADKEHTHSEYASIDAPSFTSSISMSRKAGSDVGFESIAIGRDAVASLDYCCAIGDGVSATGFVSHAEGCESTALGDYAHAEGYSTQAIGQASHSEGYETRADYDFSHAEGRGTITFDSYQHVEGKYNSVDVDDERYIHVVGNGNSDTARSNAHTLDWEGNAWFSGDVYVGSTSGTNKDTGSKKLATMPSMTKVTLAAASWNSSSLTQSATVSGILADETKQVITVAPYGTSMTAATEAGIYCSGQAANSLTFTCTTVPTAAITMVVTWQDANYI